MLLALKRVWLAYKDKVLSAVLFVGSGGIGLVKAIWTVYMCSRARRLVSLTSFVIHFRCLHQRHADPTNPDAPTSLPPLLFRADLYAHALVGTTSTCNPPSLDERYNFGRLPPAVF